MTNRMAVIVLTYKLESLSYGNSKLENWKNFNRLAIFKPGLWQTDFFGCSEGQYQQIMMSKTIFKLFS